MQAQDVLLSVRGLARSVGSRRLWQGLDLEVRTGERLAVSGPSGVGKSLLLRALAGLDALEGGEVWLRGKPQSEWPMPQFRAEVMYLLQRPAPASGTVGGHLAEPFGFRIHAGKRYEPGEAARLLHHLGRPPTFMDQDAAHLSGGEAQVVALVRALLLNPTVLLLDEATSALDAETAELAETLLRTWVDAGPARALIFVSHDRTQQERFATRIQPLSGVTA
ncbi:ABC transporter ATP-binding protein [Deinococcus arenicola]|uniref:ATP-binding cassette domain-containing protein n=1 Tax=Deinococcus arenicola TaxID=2994950 RepID=A0ABU4DR02_9DEIO|nr:ATP-binding cassette domain-containing protein [Deinococcus sp. ZS9-10]MDV6374881.1 ATP-binding cassette domain-containing protein [Deinococcus sp. ZS9-10]